MWITNPPEKSRTPSWAKYPPPQSRNASMPYTKVDHNGTSRHQHEELDAAEHAPEEQERGDRGEHELEVGQRGRREVEGDHRVGRRHRLALFTRRTGDEPRFADEVVDELGPPPDADLGRHPVLDPTTEGVRAETHLVGPEEPGDHHQREAGEHHRHDVHRPLLLDDRRVEHGQAGEAHQADERSGHDLPCVVPGVEPTGVRNLRHHC